MKQLLQKAPLFLFIYLSLILGFILAQYSKTMEIYFPYFKVEGTTISSTAIDIANTIEETWLNQRKKDHTLVMELPVDDIELPETSELDNSNVLAVVEKPTPTPIFGEPLEDIIAASQPSSYYQEAPVKQSYFDDAVFLGDSRTVGLKLYSGWDNCDFLCDVGMTIYDCLDRDIEFCDISHTTAREILSSRNYGKVYIMLGINECGSNIDTFIDKYAEVIDQIHRWQPQAVIVVQSIMKVGASKSASHASINNPNLTRRNERLAEFANDYYIYYLDINPAVCDADGNLNSGYSFDQVHLYAKYYSLWCDYLLEHGFVFSGLRR